MGQEDLLIRIDERLKKVQEELERIETGLKTASSNVAKKFEGTDKKFEDTDKILNGHSIEIAKNSMKFNIILSVFVTSALGGFAYLAKLLFGVKG